MQKLCGLFCNFLKNTLLLGALQLALNFSAGLRLEQKHKI